MEDVRAIALLNWTVVALGVESGVFFTLFLMGGAVVLWPKQLSRLVRFLIGFALTAISLLLMHDVGKQLLQPYDSTGCLFPVLSIEGGEFSQIC